MHCEGARDEPDVSVARSREESIMPQAPMLQHSGIVPHARAKSLSSRRSGDEPSLHLVLAVSVHLSSAAQYPWMQADPDEHERRRTSAREMLTEPPTDTKAETMSRRGLADTDGDDDEDTERERDDMRDADERRVHRRSNGEECGGGDGDADAASDVASALINVSAALGDTLCLDTMRSFRS